MHRIMSKHVTFYITSFQQGSESYPFCTKLIKKIYKKGHGIVIHANQPNRLSELEHALWHSGRTDWPPCHTENGQLRIQPLNSSAPDILINLAPSNEADHLNWQHCLHIVPQDPTLVQLARQQFKHYQQLGYTLKTHKIG